MKITRGSDLEFVPASHEKANDPGCLKKVLADHADLIAGQVQMVNWVKLPVGKSFQPHYHEDMQEVFVIVSGTATMTVDGKTSQLTGGDAIIIDPRQVHSMSCSGEIEVTYIVFGISTGQGGKTINV